MNITTNNKMADNPKDNIEDSRNSSKVANETSDESGLCKAKAKRVEPKCNVCGKACTKQCALCRLVNYCSRECQRKDWKAHKKVCKGKIGSLDVDKKKYFGPPLDSLPDDVLVHIGKSVATLCGVRSYNALVNTSRRFHSLLTDNEIVSSIIETEKGRLLDDYGKRSGYSNFLMTGLPENLRMLQLWQIVAEIKNDNKVYYDSGFPDDMACLVLAMTDIYDTLSKNQSAVVVLDTHCGLGRVDAKDLGMNFAFNLVRFVVPRQNAGLLEWIKSRIFVRAWDATPTALASMKAAHAEEVAQGKGWVEFFFRINKMELPPHSAWYIEPTCRGEIPYSDHHESMVQSIVEIDGNRFLRHDYEPSQWRMEIVFEDEN